jgi:hypothetical protein
MILLDENYKPLLFLWFSKLLYVPLQLLNSNSILLSPFIYQKKHSNILYYSNEEQEMDKMVPSSTLNYFRSKIQANKQLSFH